MSAQEKLTKVQTLLEEIESDIKTESYEDVLNTIRYTSRQAKKQLGIISNEKDISDATVKEKIKTVEAILIGLGLANELKKVQKDLTEEQITQIQQNVAQGWKKLEIDNKNQIINAVNSETAAKNAQTNVREYIEKVRKTDMDERMKREILELQKFINDTPESGRLTIGALTQLFKSR